MALSGSFNTNSYDGRYYTLSWSATQSVAGNYSTIKWSISCAGGSGWYAERTLSATLAGVTLVSKTDRVQRYAGTIASGSFNVNHNSVGAATISGSMSVAVYYSSVNCTGSGSWNLDTIPRQATLTGAPNFNDEDNPTITYSNPAGNNVSSLQACISFTGAKDDIAYRDISKTGTSYTFSLTEAERNVLRNATTSGNSRTVTFFVRTVIGGTTFHSTAARTLSIVNATPTLTATVQDANDTTYALTGDRNKFIKYYSNAQASASYTLKKGATLSSYYVINNGARKTTTPATFNEVENGTFTFSITDSRGNVANQTVTKTVVDYVKVTCNIGSGAPNTDGDFVFNVFGNCFNGSFGAVSNTLAVSYRYKTSNGSYGDWIPMEFSQDENTYEASVSLSGLDYRESYVFQAKATDKINTVTTIEKVFRTTPAFSWNNELFEFHVPVNFEKGATGVEGGSGGTTGNNIEGDCNITGNLRLKGSGNYGNTLYFGDGSYCHITEATDDAMTIKASRINLEANGVYVYGNPIPNIATGVWTPALNSSAVSSYTVQKGWYSKLGQTVTIGWQIKATINSGYSSTSLSISGCPYTPMFMASGGGIAHNINIPANMCFEGWVVNDSGVISARTQPCNNTTAGNLNIASTSYYPSGSGTVVTLAGTIVFMANT